MVPKLSVRYFQGKEQNFVSHNPISTLHLDFTVGFALANSWECRI